ncbi:RecQ family ATP-dependent DNA helicase [Corynebacterium felinum]|uniref:DNA 3'-5' helicase n=1 Tax=Corynebacterium felinum TaxID=131318 RepID=A0ABU2BCA6_9CORY|nr:RecQ family ATP-dependent DNA helicase [Corynebacterium felinum]MDF5821813.1 RecQ family ATP-dependent DNA helicase [Corynebacterium felinum]MDR7355378.1 ATP-dependent DNA helicase RecQ [Corynebacterium felinum]WJY94730.1 ATP-dependent DNA helicase RecQ [Corynebacterium felinum]
MMVGSCVTREQATVLLKQIASDSAQLRDDQWFAIDALVNQRSRLVVVQRTGWGKSAVYFIAAKLLRSQGCGTTVIVSPLLALMRNQVQAASRAGIVAATINSANVEQWESIQSQVEAGVVNVLLISPERLNHPEFRARMLPRLASSAGMVVVDEAHCISDWGHDFRPDYRRIRDVLAVLDPRTPVLATTATANDRVVADVRAQLGENTPVLRGGLGRESLFLSVVEVDDRTTWIASHLGDFAGSGIIYCLTVAAAEDLARALSAAGFQVGCYTGRTEAGERVELEAKLLSNEVKALVATSALGMGFDKPDLGFVIHHGCPSSPVSYYQHIGRAGRGTAHAQVVLLPGREDREIWEFFDHASFPDEDTVRKLLATLESASAPLSTPAVEKHVDLSRGRLEQALKVLDVEGAVSRVAQGWVRDESFPPFFYDSARFAQLQAMRRLEQQAMMEYVHLTSCRELFLRQQLDDATATSPCGRCDNCRQVFFDSSIDPSMRALIDTHRHTPGVEIAVRKRWPERSGALQALRGIRVLCRITDLGLGPKIREIFREHQWEPVSPWAKDPVLSATVNVLKNWNWDTRPSVVVGLSCADGARDQLVDRFASQVAHIGRLPYLGLLPLSTAATPVVAQNSVFRVRGLERLWDSAALSTFIPEDIPLGPILLITDQVDSGWSLTVASELLHEHTSREILGLGLAASH